jgi:hypothetical protein
MQGPVYSHLAPVRKRQQQLLVLQAASLGLLASAAAGVVLGLGKWLGGWQPAAWVAPVGLLSGPALGALLGMAFRRSWLAAAVAVDGHYQLKDRAVTALAFLCKPPDALRELQVEDASQHLANVEPGKVVPLHLPPSLLAGAGIFAVAVALLVWPKPHASEAGSPEPIPEIVAVAQRVEEDLKEFEELARQENNPELERLVQELKKKVEEMKEPGVDEREALAKLSEMQTAIAAQQAQYNVGLVDGQLQALGEAMTAAAALDAAGKALQDAKYEKAAKELEEMEDPQLERKEAKALEEKLKQVAKGMGDVGLGQMSEAAAEMAEGAKGGKGQFKKATRTLAKEVRGHSRRKRLNELLSGELARLQEGKTEFGRNSLTKGKMPYKSTSPSSNFGAETSGNVLGEKTNMLSQRSLEQLTGTPGDGPSDTETTHSAEGRQQAARQYRDVYQKYRKLSEAVLDSEPIPLGHRQTIRKYFELIRPQNADTPEPAK